MSVLFNWDSYKIVDLPEPVKLCNKYLKHFNLNAEAFEELDEECDLLIADSSVAECDWETQQKYLKLINKAKYAYIVYNTLFTEAGRNLFDLFIGGLKNFTIKSEHPLHHLDGRIVGHIKILYLKKNAMA